MKAGLQLKLGQSLTLTPQLRQAIRLLQLSSIELQTEINLALESNPLLERPEDNDDPDAIDDDAERAESEQEDDDEEDTVAVSEEPAASAEEAVYEDEAFDWDEGAFKPAVSAEYEESREARHSPEEDLGDHLHWQLHLTPMSDRDRAIAVTLIDALDDSGYLQEPADAITQALLPEHVDVEEDEIEAVRHLLQRFDPLGVASRTLAESLQVFTSRKKLLKSISKIWPALDPSGWPNDSRCRWTTSTSPLN
jgi:RNA polymerase sigma-54 factor